MNTGFKKSCLLVICLMGFVISTYAQQNHFIYLQTENKQPFYVRLDKKLMSSTASGYLIIPKLQDGVYNFKIGFPKNEWAEQQISCTLNKKDAGYVLKNFADKGWGLFNLQTMEVVMAASKVLEKTTAETAGKTDDFATTLSNVVKDPSIAKKEEEKTVQAEEVKKAAILPEVQAKQTINSDSAAAVSKDSLVITKVVGHIDSVEEVKQVVTAADIKQDKTTVTDVIKKELPDSLSKQISSPSQAERKEEFKIAADTAKQSVAKTAVEQVQEVKAPAQISKLLSSDNSEGIELVYADVSNGKADTIRIFIPIDKAVKEIPLAPLEKEGEQKPVIKQEQKLENAPKFIDITLPNPNAKTDTVAGQAPVVISEKKAEPVPITEKPKEIISKPMIANSDCKSFATDDDFLKLRKKMAAENSDDEMLNAAKKIFKTKCFTTDHVKNLSVLFLTDEGKYKFYDLAYPFVSDSYNFISLESQLKEAYYIERFKVMIRH